LVTSILLCGPGSIVGIATDYNKNNIYLLQLGFNLVEVVILHVYKT